MLVSLIVAVIAIGGLLFFFIPHQLELNANYEEAKKNLDIANENLAQAYADMPWTMEHIIEDINSHVASGEYDRAAGDWLIQRVTEIRNPNP